MSNRYHYNINLPFDFIPFNLGCGYGPAQVQIDLQLLNETNPQLFTFLDKLNLTIDTARLFQSLPGDVYSKHIDFITVPNVDTYDLNYISSLNRVKLNFIFNSKGTVMEWYRLLDGFSGYGLDNVNNISSKDELLLVFPEDGVEKIYEAVVDQNCILDAATIHCLYNPIESGLTRSCYSIVLENKNKETLTWESAVDLLRPYLSTGL